MGTVRNGFIYFSETKTKEPRKISINDELNEMFKQIRKKQHLTSKYVFTCKDKPIKSVKKAFKSVLNRAGIDDFRFLNLRRTFASQALMRGGTLNDM